MPTAEFGRVATRRSPEGVKTAHRLFLLTLSWAPWISKAKSAEPSNLAHPN